MSKKVNWGVLGTASIASGCTIPGMMLANNCNLYAIAGRSESKVNSFIEKFGFEKGYIGYDKLLHDKEVDAVYIPLTNDLHKEWVIKACKAGKHVLCEKPLALNADDAKEMFKVAHENNVYLMEAFAYLHCDYMKALVNDIKSGDIGDVIYIDTAFVTQGYKENTNFRLEKELGGGMIYDLGVYCTSMILSLVDSEIEYARAIAEKTDKGVDSFSGVIIKFKNGVRASFNVGMILGTERNARYDRLFIQGTNGVLRSDAEYNGAGEMMYHVTRADEETITKKLDVPNNYALEITNLSNCILNGEKPYVTSEFSIRNAELIDRLLESIEY